MLTRSTRRDEVVHHGGADTWRRGSNGCRARIRLAAGQGREWVN
jgi:hypothetical protein